MKPALAEQVLPAITAALDDTALQTAAIQAAARLGTEGKALVPALKKLQTSGPDAIRAAAADAGAVIELSLDAVPKTDPKKMSAADRRAWNIKRALLYLVKQQLPDGSWDSGMGANDQAILATTCWSALALMASGNTQYQSRIDQASAACSWPSTMPPWCSAATRRRRPSIARSWTPWSRKHSSAWRRPAAGATRRASSARWATSSWKS
jgi:hypothetical protein